MMHIRSPKLGRPARLSREAIVSAALEFDLDKLTVRALAQQLGVAHSALYRWVSDRDELLDLVSDALLERVGPPAEPAEGDWRGWLTELAWAMRREFLPITGIATALPRLTPAHDALHEDGERILRANGVPPEAVTETYLIFLITVRGWISTEQGVRRGDAREAERRFGSMLDVLLRGLPAT
jgi:AcrR family transcriptional regulator